ncbi:radical SAM protein [uncultured Tyzzerella sp.]|uniref:radical SAM protein n=1 Tax=uncultured Tyzzerella sp. TaxID=2321398 RepID=UPI002941D65C|nr:radical SAM protein [uncultured Tyzzerella sp.]
MELSHYTNIIKVNNRNFLFNSLYGTLDEINQDFFKSIYDKTLIKNEKDNMLERKYFDYEDQFITYKNMAKKYYEDNKIGYRFYIMYSLKCNLKCTYCFQNREDYDKQLDIYQLDNILDFILEKISKEHLDDNEIILYGGEPLLEQNYNLIEKTLKFASENDLDIRIITNGVNIEKFLELIINYKNIIKDIIITVDGNKKTHNKTRIFYNNLGTYDIIEKNIKILKDKKINYTIRANLNYEMFENILNNCELSDIMLNSKKSYYRVHFDDYNNNLPFKNIIELYLKNKVEFNELSINQVKSFISLIETENIYPIFRYCNREKINVFYPNGKSIYNCTELYTEDKDITKSKYHFKYNLVCKECKLLPICGGGCPAENKNDFKKYTECMIYNDLLDMVKYYIEYVY